MKSKKIYLRNTGSGFIGFYISVMAILFAAKIAAATSLLVLLFIIGVPFIEIIRAVWTKASGRISEDARLKIQNNFRTPDLYILKAS